MPVAKKFDKNFFIFRNDHDHLRKLWYIIGISLFRYSTHVPVRNGRTRNRWTHRDKKLVEIVKMALNSDHKITETSQPQSMLTIESDLLAERIGRYGLTLPKEERELPEDLTIFYEDHLLRGILDAEAKCRLYERTEYRFSFQEPLPGIRIRIPKEFRDDFKYMILRKAGVRMFEERDGLLECFGDDLNSVAASVYKDWKFIQKHGLYLPDKLDAFVKNANYPDPRKVVEENH